MRCLNCNCFIKEDMNFCPFCGTKNSETKNIKILYNDNYENDVNKNTKELLELALSGDNIAKDAWISKLNKNAFTKNTKDQKAYMEIFGQSNQGNLFAMAAMGVFEWNGGDLRDNKLSDKERQYDSFQLISKAADKGESLARYQMALWHTMGNAYVDKDPYMAFEMMEELSEENFPSANYVLGDWYFYGKMGISQNQELGREYLERAATYNNRFAINELMKIDKPFFENFGLPSLSEEEKKEIRHYTSNKVYKEGGFFKELNVDNICTETNSLSFNKIQSQDDLISYTDHIDSNFINPEEKDVCNTLINNYFDIIDTLSETIAYETEKNNMSIEDRVKIECIEFLRGVNDFHYRYRYTINNELVERNSNHLDRFIEKAKIPATDEIFYMIDNSIFKNGKAGLALTTSGIYSTVLFLGIKHLSYKDFFALKDIICSDTIIKGITNNNKDVYMMQALEDYDAEYTYKILKHLHHTLKNYVPLNKISDSSSINTKHENKEAIRTAPSKVESRPVISKENNPVINNENKHEQDITNNTRGNIQPLNIADTNQSKSEPSNEKIVNQDKSINVNKYLKDNKYLEEEVREKFVSYLFGISDINFSCRYTFNSDLVTKNGKYIDRIMMKLGIPKNDEIYYMIDTSVLSNGNTGFAITTSGIYGSIIFLGKKYINYKDFIYLEDIVYSGTLIDGLISNGQTRSLGQTSQESASASTVRILKYLHHILNGSELDDNSPTSKYENGTVSDEINNDDSSLIKYKNKEESNNDTLSYKKFVLNEVLESIYSNISVSSSSFIYGTPVQPSQSKKYYLAKANFSIPENEIIYLINDSTILGSCKTGLAICESGIYITHSKGRHNHIPWSQFSNVVLNKGFGFIEINNFHITCIYEDEMLTILQQLKEKIGEN